MNEMPKIAAESLLPVVRERMEDAVRKIMDAVNSTQPGELITGSEEAARDIGHELVRGVYEAALQQRITAAEAAFSPSAGGDDRPQAAESREAAHDRAVRHGPRQSAADVVAFSGERPRRWMRGSWRTARTEPRGPTRCGTPSSTLATKRRANNS